MIYFWSFRDSEGGILGYGENIHDARERLADKFEKTAEELDINRNPTKVYPLTQFQFMVSDDLISGW